jgi:nudix-type nucleoside diphosphatase (YffH/AdpP family)
MMMDKDDVDDRVRLRELKVLSDHHYVLRKATFDWRRGDGRWQTQIRESYDMGDGAAVLPYDAKRGMVLLIRQFRWPVYEAGYRQTFIEAIAGKLDGDEPAACVRREAMEEAGARIFNKRRIFHSFMSPGALKEQLSLFVADYDSTEARGPGGGHAHEGEDIEVLEMTLDAALGKVASGEICDAKTVMLLQYLKLNG